jgi:Tol biopolymer transport system component
MRVYKSLAATGLALGIALLALSCSSGHGRRPTQGSTPTLTGHVITATGAPSAGAAVQLSLLSSVTDSGGNFNFSLQSPGNYGLSVQGSDGVFASQTVAVNTGNNQITVTLNPSPGEFTVVGVEPKLNALAVPLTGPFQISFSRNVNPTADLPTAFVFTPSIGNFSVAVDGAAVTLTPARELKLGQRYKLRIGGVRAIDGTRLNHEVFTYFTADTVDDIAPAFILSSPSNGATNVPLNQTMLITYSDVIAPPAGGFSAQFTPEAAIREIAAEDNILRISFLGMLAANTDYTLNITPVRDYSGNYSQPVQITFKTGTTALAFDDIEPTWNVFSNAIIFSRAIGGKYDLFQINADGSGLLQLTSTPANERHPSYSSDGSLVTYASDESGDWDIWVQSVSTGEKTRLTYLPEDETSPAFCGTFSQLIAYVRREGSPASSHIYLMNADGSFSRRADDTSTRDETSPSFHPLLDNQMLFVASEGGDYDIFSKSAFLESDNPVNVDLTSDLTGNEYEACFSADGSTIAFISDQTGVKNVWVMDPAGSAHYAVTRFTDTVDSMTYSPISGDDRVVVSMGPSNSHSLYVVSLVSGNIERRLTE